MTAIPSAGRADSVCRSLACLALAVVSFEAGLASAHAEPPRELWKINVDGTGLARFADTSGYICGSPDWSPNGKLVAYDTWPVEKQLRDSQIAVIRADGTERRLLGPGAMPSWSPDGKQLVFHVYGSGNETDHIVVMNADGTGRETIINHWGSPRWSPRGNRIASILDSNIALYDVATGTERPILPAIYSVYWGFGISPDGLRICFGGDDGGVYLATLNEQQMKASVRTLADTGKCYHASFAPDGKRIVFAWQPTGAKFIQLYTTNPDTNESPRPITGQGESQNNMNPDWSSDGKTIIFASQSPLVTK